MVGPRQLLLTAVFTCSLVQISNAQNYRTLRAGTTFYTSESHPNDKYKNLINAIRIDSVAVTGSDSMFYNFPQIRYVDNCIRPDGPSWIGMGMLAKPDGTNLFFNAEGDTITIMTQAKLGDNWRLYSYEDGKWLRATVSDIDTATFLGITDSVKTISLQMMQWQDIEISDKLNAVKLKLSKKYGLIRFPNFYSFPSIRGFGFYFVDIDMYSIIYNISGIDDPSRRVKNLTLADAFDLYPMDVLQVVDYHTSMYREENRTNSTEFLVLGREESADTLWISFNIRTHFEQAYPGHPKYINSITNIHRKEAYPKKEPMGLLPLEPVFETTWTDLISSSVMYINKDEQVAKDVAPLDNDVKLCKENVTDTCYGWCFLHGDEQLYSYIKGLGGPYYVYEVWNMGYYEYGRKLVYYKKGNEEWGTPLDIAETTHKAELSVYPNPAGNSTTITFPEAVKGELHLINTLGQAVYTATIHHQSQINLPLTDTPAGIYIIKVLSESGEWTTSLFKTNTR